MTKNPLPPADYDSWIAVALDYFKHFGNLSSDEELTCRYAANELASIRHRMMELRCLLEETRYLDRQSVVVSTVLVSKDWPQRRDDALARIPHA